MLNNYTLFSIFCDYFNNLVISCVFLVPENIFDIHVSYFMSYIKCVTFFVIGLSFSDMRFFISQQAVCNSANICTNFVRADWPCASSAYADLKATLYY